ncbi:MAG: sigma-70 family RNA polymerase sigma factor [Rickettsiales bacterium]
MTTESPQDAALLVRIQDGDRGAFAALVQKHHETFYHLAYRYMQSRDEAEDMVQTAFLKLWEYPDRWNPEKGGKFTTWFYRVVVNLCLDAQKKHKTSALPESFEAEDSSPNQEIRAMSKQTHAALEKQLATLPDRQRMALILCFYQELPHKEAAGVMRISVKALRSLLMRAKTTLSKQMKPYLTEARYG